MAATSEQVAPPKRGRLGWLVLGVVSLLAVSAGAALPLIVPLGAHPAKGDGEHEAKAAGEPRKVFVAFGDVSVNLNEERATRYLRVKLILVVDAAQEKVVSDLVAKNKAILKNWLISHLADKSVKDVTGAAGVNRARREILEHFNSQLFPDGSEKIRDVLFEEYFIQ